MKFGGKRREPARGSIKGGWKSRRVMISFPDKMFVLLLLESAAKKAPFSEIVRQRIIKGYEEQEPA